MPEGIGYGQQPQQDQLPKFNFAPQARNAAQSYAQSLSFQDTDQFSIKQRKPLAKRQTIGDYYDYSVTEPDKIGNQLLTINPVGGVGQNQAVGYTESKQLKVNPSRARQALKPVSNYVQNYAKMDTKQRNVGAINTFYDSLMPFFSVTGSDVAGGKFTKEDQKKINQQLGIVGETVDAFSLGANWSNLSDLGRVKETANQFVQTSRQMGYKLPQATSPLASLNFAYSAHTLMNNWDKMSPEQRSVATLHTINSGVQAYSTAAPFMTFSSAGTSGTVTAANAGKELGKEVAIKGTESTGSTLASNFSTGMTYLAAAYGAYNIMDQWGTGGAGGRANGAMNGAAVGMIWGPIGAAVGAFLGTGIGSIKTGKSHSQTKRDAFRGHYEKTGLFVKQNGNHQVQLADGSSYDVGVDGSNGRAMHNGEVKTVWNEDLVAERDKGKFTGGGKEIRPYDVDYTNDLDYVTSLATSGLNYMINGGSSFKDMEGRQMNGYLTNAATSNVAGRDFSQENFASSMNNVRAFYSRMGIQDKGQARQHLDKLRQAKKISKNDYNAAILGLDFAFDQNFEGATRLNQELGREQRDTTSKEEFDQITQEDVATVEA